VVKVPVTRVRLICIAVAAAALSLAAVGAGIWRGGGSTPGDGAGVASAVTAPAAVTRPVLYNYAAGWQHGRVEPHVIYVGNGGAPFTRRLIWSHWNGTSAYATGIMERQFTSCTSVKPSAQCAYHPYRAEVTLSRPETHNGVRYFSRMRWSWRTGAGAPRSLQWQSVRGFWN
jgi:hypothetical protein